MILLLNAYMYDERIHNITKNYSQIILLFSIELNKIYPNQCLLSFNLFDSLTIIMPRQNNALYNNIIS